MLERGGAEPEAPGLAVEPERDGVEPELPGDQVEVREGAEGVAGVRTLGVVSA